MGCKQATTFYASCGVQLKIQIDEELIPDGLDVLRKQIGAREIASLIERTARWTDPETFRLLPVWFPEFGRGHLFYKSSWSEPQMNTTRVSGNTIHKREGNIYANKALTFALGLRKDERPNWSCCHIWGIDDSTYQKANAVVQDRRFYSCVANMVLLPTPLKAFTDTMPEIKAMLRICARNLYSWSCDHEDMSSTNFALDGWSNWDDYPRSWPREPGAGQPLGMVKLNDTIRKSVDQRIKRISTDYNSAGEHYPREQVLEVLRYWNIVIPGIRI